MGEWQAGGGDNLFLFHREIRIPVSEHLPIRSFGHLISPKSTEARWADDGGQRTEDGGRKTETTYHELGIRCASGPWQTEPAYVSERITSFDELLVYQEACALDYELFLESKNFPREEMYSLTDQVRRSSRSIGSNIAESSLRPVGE